MRKTCGPRRRSRDLLKKPVRERGLPPVTRFLEEFKIGDKVVIKVEPSVPKGMPYIKFNGRQGEVVESRGRAYLIRFRDGGKVKSAICSPVHLRRVKADGNKDS